MQELTAEYLNQGKTLIRKDATWKLGKNGLGLLASVMVPTKDVAKMDLKVINGMTPAEAAFEWIDTYQDIFDIWSW